MRGEKRRGKKEIGRQGGREAEAERNQEAQASVQCSEPEGRRTFGHNGSTIKVQARALADTEMKAREAIS